MFVFINKYIRPVYIKFKGGQSLHNPLCISSYKLYKNIKVLKIIKCRTALQGTRMIEDTLNFNRNTKTGPNTFRLMKFQRLFIFWWSFCCGPGTDLAWGGLCQNTLFLIDLYLRTIHISDSFQAVCFASKFDIIYYRKKKTRKSDVVTVTT